MINLDKPLDAVVVSCLFEVDRFVEHPFTRQGSCDAIKGSQVKPLVVTVERSEKILFKN